MKKYLLGLAVLLMGTAVMTSCSDDNDGPETYLQVYSTGAYVVNSGNMYNKIESSLTAIDYASSTATQNVFKAANGRRTYSRLLTVVRSVILPMTASYMATRFISP